MKFIDDVIPATIVYILAEARCGPYYLYMANNVENISDHIHFQARAYEYIHEKTESLRLALVWHQACQDGDEAKQLAEKVNTMPQRWQRRLIELQNPDWVDQCILLDPPEYPRTSPHGYSILYCIPEYVPRPCPRPILKSIPYDRYSSVMSNGREWKAAIEANAPPAMRYYQHHIAIAPKNASLEEKCNLLWKFGMLVDSMPERLKGNALSPLARRYMIKFTIPTDTDNLKYTGSRDYYIHNYGKVRAYYRYRHYYEEYSKSAVQPLTEAAISSWLAAGRPDSHTAKIEIDTKTWSTRLL